MASSDLTMTSHPPALALSRLLQLASPMLPVGAYSYSQGLEWAIECGDVHDLATAKQWIGDALSIYQARFELPVLYRMYQAWQQQDVEAVQSWDAFYQAGRDTSEALAETKQMGYSLCRLLHELGNELVGGQPENNVPLKKHFLQSIQQLHEPSFPAVYAGIAHYWGIEAPQVLQGYAWGWLENQASAAMKTVPLGQVAGQKILLSLGALLPEVVNAAMAMPEDEISNFNPLLSIAGCQHETQYSRLFRS